MTVFDDAVNAAQTAALAGDALTLKVSDLEGMNSELTAQLAAQVALSADLKKQLDACQHSALPMYSGVWPETNQFDQWEGALGQTIPGYRSRGGEGEFDDPFLLSSTLQRAQQGHIVSLQVQPKTGSGPTRKGVPYTAIAAGNWDTVILAKLAQFAALPDGKYPCELHSEANVQKGAIAAQPDVGTAAEYEGFVRKIDALAKEAGVRDKLIWVTSLAGPGIWNNGWQDWLGKLDDIIEVYAIDFYSQPKSGQEKDFATGANAVMKAARSRGKEWGVFETGCQEKLGDDMYKTRWYQNAEAFLLPESVRSDCHSVWFNTSNDGAGGWMPDTTPQALNAWKSLMRSF